MTLNEREPQYKNSYEKKPAINSPAHETNLCGNSAFLSVLWHALNVLCQGKWLPCGHKEMSSGVWWSLLMGMRCLWRHGVTSNSCFKSSVLANFFTQCISLYTHPLLHNLICHCVISALRFKIQVQNTLNATTKQS